MNREAVTRHAELATHHGHGCRTGATGPGFPGAALPSPLNGLGRREYLHKLDIDAARKRRVMHWNPDAGKEQQRSRWTLKRVAAWAIGGPIALLLVAAPSLPVNTARERPPDRYAASGTTPPTSSSAATSS